MTDTLETIAQNDNATLADLENVAEPQDLPANAPVQALAVKVQASTDKKATRGIRKAVTDWLEARTAGMDSAAFETEVKSISVKEFTDKVLTVDPNWKIVAKGEKVEATHRSWYISKLRAAKFPKVAAAPTPQA